MPLAKHFTTLTFHEFRGTPIRVHLQVRFQSAFCNAFLQSASAADNNSNSKFTLRKNGKNALQKRTAKMHCKNALQKRTDKPDV